MPFNGTEASEPVVVAADEVEVASVGNKDLIEVKEDLSLTNTPVVVLLSEARTYHL